MPELPTPHMGFVNTPENPTIHVTSSQYHRISPYAGTTNATYGACPHAGKSYDTWISQSYHISPHMPKLPTPHMGSVNTPENPTTRVTSSQYHRISPYAGTANATYGAYPHAEKSYDTWDLTIISYIPHMPELPTPHMGFVNTPENPTTRVTSSQYHKISPYAGTTNATYGACPHAGKSYDTWDLTIISYISPYAGTTNATYGVCQHAGKSYDTCDLITISQNLPIRRNYQRHIWGLSTRRKILRHV
ncbi:hypothetical protein Pyn_04747 [Prunus yedoensis var. nudiflora]|uniref:Uncharacterized protein n=1 Tax=Prunus yedoensis var. nudiflora TaxID=2094558 RepID=A0A314Z0E9_PRUYE|nr:hypothetical protein Pyn_04747 [Prunus yedoensis var. nudiflora]